MKSKIIIVAVICVSLMFQRHVNATEVDIPSTVKVGFYEYDAYYYLDKFNKPAGYYHDLLELIAKELDFDYEYVRVSDSEAIDKLRNKEIDLLFGVGFTPERYKEFIYSRYYIHFDSTVVYSNDYIPFGDLYDLNGLTFGYIENELSTVKFMELLDQEEIKMNFVKADNYETLIKLFMADEVDVIIYSSYAKELKDYFKVYEFSSGPSYIITSDDHAELMHEIDQYIEANDASLNNPIVKLHDMYFNEYHRLNRYLLILISLLIVILVTIVIRHMVQTYKTKKAQNLIFKHIAENKYVLYYQPVIDLTQNQVVGCEALIRFNDGTQILSPYFFLSDIEQANMMYPLSMWILKQLIRDFKQISTQVPHLPSNFYVSMNLSFQELTHPSFISEVLMIVKQSQMKPYQICFEIVERQKLHDDKQIKVIISQLRSLGFKIAIDDFGTEYSNFDVLESIEFDILKLDKTFVEQIETSYVKQEFVKTLARITEFTNKIMVSEGVETESELKILQSMESECLYIQGYYYSKPLPIQDLYHYLIQQDGRGKDES